MLVCLKEAAEFGDGNFFATRDHYATQNFTAETRIYALEVVPFENLEYSGDYQPLIESARMTLNGETVEDAVITISPETAKNVGTHEVTVTAADSESGEKIEDHETVTDGLTLTITPVGEKYNIGEGTSILDPKGKLVITSNSQWDEYVYVLVGAPGGRPLKLPAGGSIEVAGGDPRITAAYSFKTGDTLTEVKAGYAANSEARAVLNVGVEKPRPAAKEKKPFDGISQIVTPVADGIGIIAGFMPEGSTAEIRVGGRTYIPEHIHNRAGGVTYFWLETELPMEEGGKLTLKVTAPDGHVTRRSYPVVPMADIEAESFFAEGFGQSIAGGYVNEDGKYVPMHYYLTCVDTAELDEAGMEVPILLCGGYAIGTLKIAPAEGGLKLSYTIETDKCGHDGVYTLRVYDEEPDFTALLEDSRRGDSLNMDHVIPAEGKVWIHTGFSVHGVTPAILAPETHFRVLNEAMEEIL